MAKGDDLEDLKYLYTEGILTDVELRTATRTFHAHKSILSARSPVFRAMFTTDMLEKRRDCVDLPDLDDETVGPMLLFLYTDVLDEWHWQRIFKLFSAGDRFQIVALKNKCACLMKRSLCTSEMCNVLHLPDLHGDDELKKAAQDYVLAHEEDVFSSNEWVEFAKSDSTRTLALDTMLKKWKRSTSA
ncbi:TD and POZ domain-containing protein 4 [Trichonephila clavipes]|nr:TD and POZ domain-containing protein 4 [Trichonephila clavipes]